MARTEAGDPGVGGDPLIRFEAVTFRYPQATQPALRDVHLNVPEGEMCLVVGGTGSGKSTLLRAVNGLVPHFTGGAMHGRVTVAGRDTRGHPPRELADLVGFVGQDPPSGFVSDVVEDELAYGMESLGLPEGVMRRRVEETLDVLGLADVRERSLSALSTGQQQRVALGAALTMHPRALVLDEPTSALDPVGAEEVLAALQRLVHDLGLTVLLAEHRLERVVQYADRVVHVPALGQPLVVGTPQEVMATSPVAPPVVELGRIARWSPLPLSIRDARRAASRARERLSEHRMRSNGRSNGASSPRPAPAASLAGVSARYGSVPALSRVDLDLAPGSVVALMGRNGAGKSTVLAHLAGLRAPDGGTIEVLGRAPHQLRPDEAVRRVGLVPQEPGDLLYASTVDAECVQADADMDAPPGTCRDLVSLLAPEVDGAAHPRDLSEGQRLCLALAVVLAGRPPVLLLDEPTRGLDYAAKGRLVTIVGNLAGEDHVVVLATHDVELIAEVASRTVVLAEGEVIADGPTQDVLLSSPSFAPQVTKVFAPVPALTVGDVAAAFEDG